MDPMSSDYARSRLTVAVILGALLISIVSTLLSWILVHKREK